MDDRHPYTTPDALKPAVDLLRRFRKPRGQLIQAGYHETPSPLTADWGTISPAQAYNVLLRGEELSTEQVELAFLLSDEWSEVVHKLVADVWRRGLEVAPVHDLVCTDCGEPIDDPDKACVMCNSTRSRAPDPRGRVILEDFLNVADRENRLDLVSVGRRVTEETLKHGRGYMVFLQSYDMDANGVIDKAHLKGVKAGSTRLIKSLRDWKDHPGGRFVCISCRGTTKYVAQTERGPCQHCGKVTYEAWYAELAVPDSDDVRTYWLPNEAHETRWPFEDGSPILKRILPKLLYLIYADRYVQAAVDPKKPRRMDVVLVTMGGDKESMSAWVKDQEEKLKKDPQRTVHLHIPSPPGGMGNFRADAKILQLGDPAITGHLMEIREKCERRIRAQYGGAPIESGDTEAGGGLNNEGLQLRSRSKPVEDQQSLNQKWLERLAQMLGVTEWTYRFKPPMEEDAGLELETMTKALEVAERAARNGLKVRWVGGKPRIADGDVVAPDEQAQPALFAGSRPDDAVLDQEVDLLLQSLRQAINEDEDLGEGVKAMFGGPSGAVEAGDAVFADYAGLSPEQALEVRNGILESLSQPQGWSVKSITDRIKQNWVAAGFSAAEAEAYARRVARTEVRAIASEFKRRNWVQEEARREKQFKYTVRGADDFRTTKQSRWVRNQVPKTGLTLQQIEALLDRAVQLTKQGAFTRRGQYASVEGEPILLPDGFQRRGFLIAYNDRDEVVRLTRPDE